MSVLLEVCVDSRAGLEAAIAGGADRIELCSALDVGGLTPSAALIAAAQGAPVPVYAMIRPRPGDFAFTPAEVTDMAADIAAVRAAGLAGVVLGIGTPEGLDLAGLRALSEAAGDLGRTLHRVVDLLDDRRPALDAALALGFERILTSGGARRAADGTADIASLVTLAGARLSVMPGSGVTPANAAAILAATGAREIHASCRTAGSAAHPRLVELGYAAARPPETDAATVAALKRAIA